MPAPRAGISDRILFNLLKISQRLKSGARFRTIESQDRRIWPLYVRRPVADSMNDGVPVVFFHGFGNDGTTWLPFFEVIGTHREVVAPDFPGFGAHPLLDSETPNAGWYRAVTAAFLRELTIRWGQPPIVIGKSMGGMIAGMVAGELPDLVRALVLIDPAGLETPRVAPFWEAWQSGTNHLLPRDENEWSRMESILYHRFVPLPGFVKRYALATLSGNRERYQRIFDGLLADGFNPLGERLHRITCPVTVIWGAHDKVIDPSGATMIQTALPNARIEVLSDCGHSPTREQPDEVRRILLEVLSRWG